MICLDATAPRYYIIHDDRFVSILLGERLVLTGIREVKGVMLGVSYVYVCVLSLDRLHTSEPTAFSTLKIESFVRRRLSR